MKFPMTGTAQPLNVKSIFFCVAEIVMGICFCLSGAQIAEIFSGNQSLLHGSVDRVVSRLSCFMGRILPVGLQIIQNFFSIVPVVSALFFSCFYRGLEGASAQLPSPVSIIFSSLRLLVVRAEIGFSAFFAARHKAAGFGPVDPEFRFRLQLFA